MGSVPRWGSSLFLLTCLSLQNAEHAGYRRRILQRNPSRYDSEGDELDDDDSDATADADAAEENPYSEIALASESPLLSFWNRLCFALV